LELTEQTLARERWVEEQRAHLHKSLIRVSFGILKIAEVGVLILERLAVQLEPVLARQQVLLVLERSLPGERPLRHHSCCFHASFGIQSSVEQVLLPEVRVVLLEQVTVLELEELRALVH